MNNYLIISAKAKLALKELSSPPLILCPLNMVGNLVFNVCLLLKDTHKVKP